MPAEPPVRLLLVDDHEMVRAGLRTFLGLQPDMEVVGEAGTAEQALALVPRLRPDIVLLDLVLPGMSGLEAVRRLRSAHPEVKVVVLTSYAGQDSVLPAVRAGVSGYLLKTRAAEDLVQAIREVSRGTLYLSPGVSREVLQAHLNGEAVPADPLSTREREVLQLIAEGKSMKEIAALLTISVKTVETHRMRLTGKLEIHDTASLVRYAIRRGMIRP